jgi:ATP-dependent exoDNAse (exonuclease V) beta subunit
VAIEREALRNGLAVIDELSPLRSRWPLDRLLARILDRTGYRAHLELLDQPAPKLANIARFLRLLEDYRYHTVGTFLELWARWEAKDLGIPQAPLYSKGDTVVTLSTIHSAKGLEWPVVFLVDSQQDRGHNYSNDFWSDRDLGPVICHADRERGARGTYLRERNKVEDEAESARILYVATTRAKDRLILTGPTAPVEKLKGHLAWLVVGRSQTELTGAIPSVTLPPAAPEPQLDWLGDVSEASVPPASARPIHLGRLRYFRSATELMTYKRKHGEWELRYRHGVVPHYYFAPGSVSGGGVPARIRGDIIHGVLERIQDEAELAELLDVTIGALDAPELEERLAAGTEYRLALEKEIEAVVQSDEWKGYTDGEHYRELPFVQLVSPCKWRVGAFDLFRFDPNLIVDFKTHDIPSEDAEKTAGDYRLQALLYRAAARALARDPQVRFHFTKPNRAVDFRE